MFPFLSDIEVRSPVDPNFSLLPSGIHKVYVASPFLTRRSATPAVGEKPPVVPFAINRKTDPSGPFQVTLPFPLIVRLWP